MQSAVTMRTLEFVVARDTKQTIVKRIASLNGGVNVEQLAKDNPRRLFEQLMKLMNEYNAKSKVASTLPINIRTNFDLGIETTHLTYDHLPAGTMVSLVYYYDADDPMPVFCFFKDNR